ncbi:MAG: 4-alpha-glucanotransferase [Anaerolineales bacterium]|nr:4-alpha-glucanotransferase [Anaerolineales bacterium]
MTRTSCLAFSGLDNPLLPHLYTRNCVAYTGTHDNDTARGWYASAPESERDFALRYIGLGCAPSEAAHSGFAWELIRAVWASVAVFALTPMQDLLNLGTEARINYPSRLGGNWEWRMAEGALSEELKEKLNKLNYLYSR